MRKLVIRFKRLGNLRRSIFSIVVMSQKSRSKGFIFDKIGVFNPNIFEHYFYINSFRLGFWLNRGAIMRPSVIKNLSKFLVSK